MTTPITRWERGSMTVETVIVLPLVLLAVMIGIQWVLYKHAEHIAFAAAQDGARVARAEHASGGQGSAAALSFARQVGSGILLSPSASVQVSTSTITVVVRGQAQQVTPLRLPLIEARSSGGRERFTLPGGGTR